MLNNSDRPDRTDCFAPSTGEVIGSSSLNSLEDIRNSVAQARAAQTQWAALSLAKRVRLLRPLQRYLTDHTDELAQIISQDNGKTRTDALAAEVVPAGLAAAYYCRKAKSFLKDRRLMPGSVLLANKLSKITRVPFGVVGIISPWNYPFALPFSEVVMALLAGNAVILKTASETQLVGRAIEKCFASLDLPLGLFNYINMPGSQAGKAFLEIGVDKLFFTGSVAVGKQLMAQAAESLTPLVLELGGNDPMLVCPDADLQRAAAGAVWAGMQNCGQSCGGVERVYVHEAVYEPFLKLLKEKVERLRIGIDLNHNVELGAMTTAGQMREVQRQVDAAVQAGARIYARSRVPAKSSGNFMPAMVLTDVNHDMDVMRLETFGPVLGVMAVSDMSQAVALANDSNLGLSGSVWTKDAASGEILARRIQAGSVMINDHLTSHGMAETPWGGFKQSGIGRTHGAIGMEEMTQSQCLVHDHLPFVKRNFWWHPNSPVVYHGLKGVLQLLYGQGAAGKATGLGRLLRIVPRIFFSDDGEKS